MRSDSSVVTVSPSRVAKGRVTVPGDKSISHRYAMLAAIARGLTTIRGFSTGLDCLATLDCIRAVGIDVRLDAHVVSIAGRGANGLQPSTAALDARNSGTTMRLMSGILSAQPFTTEFVGDASLSRRPMRRIIAPLTAMGARIESTDGRPPLRITGAPLRAIEFTPEIPSAQVKSCVLLAGLYADGVTSVVEPIPTRDHTERALRTFGARVETSSGGGRIAVAGGQGLHPQDLVVPGDISGAAFWCALAAATPGGDISIDNVGLNPSRTSFLSVLARAGGGVELEAHHSDVVEPVGTIRVVYRDPSSFSIDPAEVPGLIDEIPALAAMAAMLPDGCSMTVRGAAELRVKESDRISALAAGFRAMGAVVDEFADGFRLQARPLVAAEVDAAGDHRLAMAFMIAATKASGPVRVRNAAVDVSYPGFLETLTRLTAA